MYLYRKYFNTDFIYRKLLIKSFNFISISCLIICFSCCAVIFVAVFVDKHRIVTMLTAKEHRGVSFSFRDFMISLLHITMIIIIFNALVSLSTSFLSYYIKHTLHTIHCHTILLILLT